MNEPIKNHNPVRSNFSTRSDILSAFEQIARDVVASRAEIIDETAT